MNTTTNASTNSPTYRPRAIHITVVIMALIIPIFCYIGISGSHGEHFFQGLVPLLLIIAVIGIKFAAPAIPWWQLVILLVVILALHYGVEHAGFPPLSFVAEMLFEIICVSGFGAWWVKEGFIPKGVNYW